jgi:hypothetical protein
MEHKIDDAFKAEHQKPRGYLLGEEGARGRVEKGSPGGGLQMPHRRRVLRESILQFQVRGLLILLRWPRKRMSPSLTF